MTEFAHNAFAVHVNANNICLFQQQLEKLERKLMRNNVYSLAYLLASSLWSVCLLVSVCVCVGSEEESI